MHSGEAANFFFIVFSAVMSVFAWQQQAKPFLLLNLQVTFSLHSFRKRILQAVLLLESS